MKLTTAAICANCDEIYDIALYRVCPACTSNNFTYVSKYLAPTVDQDTTAGSKDEKTGNGK